MGLHALLERGIRSALDDGGHTLEEQLGHLPGDTVEHVRQTLEAFPGLLVAIDRALWHKSTPPEARALFMVVVSYLLADDDLVPTSEARPVLGLLDDAYLLHRAAQELRDHLEGVELRSVDGGTQLLQDVLPPDVVRQLDAKVEDALRDARTLLDG